MIQGLYQKSIKPFLRQVAIPLFGLAWEVLAAVYRLLPKSGALRKRILKIWKRLNKRLARMEKNARKTRVWSFPIELNLENTVKCNLQCPICFRSYVELTHQEFNRTPDMQIELFNQIVDELYPTAEFVSTTLAGEPFLSEYLDRYLEALEENDLRLVVVTNGMMLSRPGLIERIAPLLNCLEISFDSAEPAQFEHMRKGAKFDRVLANARRVGEIRRSMPEPRFRFGFSLVIFEYNMDQLHAVIRLMAEIGGQHVRVCFGNIFSEEDEKTSVSQCPERYNRLFEAAHITARECGIELWMPEPFVEEDPDAKVIKGECHYLYYNAHISLGGMLRACCHPEPPQVGKYEHGKFRSLWNNPVMRHLRAEYHTDKAPPACRDCFIINRGAGTVANRERESFIHRYSNQYK